jgi:hypothetical protein
MPIHVHPSSFLRPSSLCSLPIARCAEKGANPLFPPSLTATPNALASDDSGCASSNQTSTPTHRWLLVLVGGSPPLRLANIWRLHTRRHQDDIPTVIPPSHHHHRVAAKPFPRAYDSLQRWRSSTPTHRWLLVRARGSPEVSKRLVSPTPGRHVNPPPSRHPIVSTSSIHAGSTPPLFPVTVPRRFPIVFQHRSTGSFPLFRLL